MWRNPRAGSIVSIKIDFLIVREKWIPHVSKKITADYVK